MAVTIVENIKRKTQRELLSLRNDAVFKLFFGNEANKNQLRRFLKATTNLTDDDLVEIDILNPILTKEHVVDKDFVVDIRIKDASRNFTHLDMQMSWHEAFIERMVAYNARQYASQLSPGDDYTQLRRSISLIITDFPMFDDTDEYFEYITYRRKNRKIFTNAQEYFILDLTKLPDEVIDEKAMWGALFKAESEKELRALMKMSSEFNEAGERLLHLSEDKYAREIARAREESQWAWKHTLYHTKKHGIEQGITQGITQGIKQGIKQVAAELYASKMPITEIVRMTGLTEAELLTLTTRGL